MSLKSVSIKTLCFTIILTVCGFVQAETVYVSDELSINMRTDKGNQFRITKVLKSGSKLRVLQVDKSGYTKVKAEGGSTGWVLSRFLSKEPIAREQVKQAKARAAKLQIEKKQLQEELKQFKKDKTVLSQSEQRLLQHNQKLTTEVNKLRKIAARPMQLEADNETLRNELLKNEAQSRLLKQEHQTLLDAREKEWFMAGAGILFGGILLGLVLPKLRSNNRRRQNWNRL